MAKKGLIAKTLDGLSDPKFWVDALAIIGGYKLADVLNTYLGDMLPENTPNFVRMAVGPVAVFGIGIALSGTAGQAGRGFKIGAMVYVVDELLDAIGFGGMEA